MYRQQNRHLAKSSVLAPAQLNQQGLYDGLQVANTSNEGHLSSATAATESASQPFLPPPSRGQALPAPPQPPEFCGPSSSEFTLNVVNGNLKAMGISAVIGDASASVEESTSNRSFQPAQYGPFMKMLTMDPLWDLKREDALRLVSDYCHSIGSLYPVVDHQQMLATAVTVFRSLESAQEGRLKDRGVSAAEAIFNPETNKLKVVIAIGRTLESGGRNDQAQRLFQSITEAVEGLLWNLDGINGIQLLVLVALYHYHLDEEVRTGRIIGFAARLCLEMGLHRREMVARTFPNAEDQTVALKVFWSVYMLERRTSLGLGIPFSIQDSHIDPSLFTLSMPSPFISIMIDWTKLAGKTWQALNGQCEKGSMISRDEIDYLDYQIIQWYKQIPIDLQLHQVGFDHQARTIQDGQDPMYLPAVLFIRKNHLRNLVYRPTLQSVYRITENKRYGLMAVEVAKESIQTFSDLNRATKLIATHPIFFKHFLLTAFGNLLLAVVNATSDFWDDVRDEFHLALRLIRLLSARSVPLMRLWHCLKGLEELQAKMLFSLKHDPANFHLQQSATTSKSPANSSNDLLPNFPVISELSKTGGPSEYSIGGPQMRDEFASLFDTSVGSDCFFDFPFVDFGTTT